MLGQRNQNIRLDKEEAFINLRVTGLHPKSTLGDGTNPLGASGRLESGDLH